MSCCHRRGTSGSSQWANRPEPTCFTFLDRIATFNPDLANAILVRLFLVLLRFQLEGLPDVRPSQGLDVQDLLAFLENADRTRGLADCEGDGTCGLADPRGGHMPRAEPLAE